jgi:hypothetical protein
VATECRCNRGRCKPCQARKRRESYAPTGARDYAAQLPTLSAAELGWAAGVMEGEGTVSISNAGKRRSGEPRVTLSAQVTNTDRDIIDFFATRWVTTAITQDRRDPRHKAKYTWMLRGARAAAFLAQLRPYVQSQRMLDRIDAALEFDAARAAVASRYRGWRDGGLVEIEQRYRERMMALNRKGPPDQPGD